MPADLKYQFLLSAKPAKVFEILSSTQYLSDKISHAKSGDFTISGTSPNLEIQIKRKLAGPIPAIVSKFVGPELTVTEIQMWEQADSQTYFAHIELKIEGAPVEINGKLNLNGNSSTNVSFAGKVKVNIPIFGAAVEPQVVQEITKVLAMEEDLFRNKVLD